MKKLLLLKILILLSLSSYSQGLTPDKVILDNGDTLLCWNITKSRIIAQKLVWGEYCDSILFETERKVREKDAIIDEKKKVIGNLSLQKANQDKSLELKNQEVGILRKEIKWQKGLKWLGFGVATVLGGVVVFK